MEKVTNDYQNIFISATSVGYIVGGPFEGKKMVGRSLAFQNGKKILVMKKALEISTEMQIIEIDISNEQRNYGTEISEKIDIKI